MSDYLYYCAKCNSLIADKYEDDDVPCDDCWGKMTPLHITEDTWSSMTDAEKTALLDKYRNPQPQVQKKRPSASNHQKSKRISNTGRSYETPEKDYYDKISGLSITSFVLSFFISIVGIILGIIDLTKDDGRKKGLSIASISIGSVMLIATIGFVLFSTVFKNGTLSDTQSIEEIGQESTDNLASILTKDQWIDAIGESITITFNEDGSGRFDNEVMNWRLDGSYITVSIDQKSDMVLTITSTSNGYQLTLDDSVCVFVPTNNLSSVQRTIREDAVKSAIDVDLDSLFTTAQANKAKASQEYEGKLGKVNVFISIIGENSLEEKSTLYGNGFIKTVRVYLPTSTLANLHTESYIEVVGQLSYVSDSMLIIDNAFMADDYIAKADFSDSVIQDAIRDFHDDGDGKITWSEGSFPFFIDNRLAFTLIEGTDADNLLCSTKWNAKYYVEPEKNITLTFKKNGSLIETENGSTNNWDWKNVGGLEFPTGTGRDYEIRMINDNTLVFYTKDQRPQWILYK